MDKISNFLTYLDLFGFDLTFRHKRFTKYRTYYGGIVTIICFIVLCYGFFEFAKDCLHKENPLIRETSYYDEKSIIDIKHFFFSLFFSDLHLNHIPNPEKYLIFHGVLTNITDNKTISNIPFVKCNYEKHLKHVALPKEKFDKRFMNFNETFCLDYDETFSLLNSLNEFPRVSLSIYVIECKNTTVYGINCESFFLNQS